MGDLEHIRDFFFWWVCSLLAAASIVAAKLGVRLFVATTDEPADPVLSEHWHRRRRYVAIGEISALPAFATISVVVVMYYHADPIASVLLAMGQGAVGFALMLDGAAFLFRKRLGLPGNGETNA